MGDPGSKPIGAFVSCPSGILRYKPSNDLVAEGTAIHLVCTTRQMRCQWSKAPRICRMMLPSKGTDDLDLTAEADIKIKHLDKKVQHGLRRDDLRLFARIVIAVVASFSLSLGGIPMSHNNLMAEATQQAVTRPSRNAAENTARLRIPRHRPCQRETIGANKGKRKDLKTLQDLESLETALLPAALSPSSTIQSTNGKVTQYDLSKKALGHMNNEKRRLLGFSLYPMNNPELETSSRYRHLLQELCTFVEENYVDQEIVKANWAHVKQQAMKLELNSLQKYYDTMQWVLEQFKDPFTRFLTPSQMAEIKDDLDGVMVGVGIVFSKVNGKSYFLVHDVIPDSPAGRHGIRRDNRIVSIDGVPASRMTSDEARELLHGKLGSTVELEVWYKTDLKLPAATPADVFFLPEGLPMQSSLVPTWSPTEQAMLMRYWVDPITFTMCEMDAPIMASPGWLSRKLVLARDDFKIPSVIPFNFWISNLKTNHNNRDSSEIAGILPEPARRVVYIRVTEFSNNTARETKHALRHLETDAYDKYRVARESHVLGKALKPFPCEDPLVYVIDLRGNAGGILTEAVEFCRLFLPRPGDRIVSFQSRESSPMAEETSTLWSSLHSRLLVHQDAPIIVLADQMTASASEIVAAALRDNCRAIIIGTKSFGKGSVQAVMELSDGSGFVLTIARYRTPRGHIIEKQKGIHPDIIKSLPLISEYSGWEQQTAMDREDEFLGSMNKERTLKMLESLVHSGCLDLFQTMKHDCLSQQREIACRVPVSAEQDRDQDIPMYLVLPGL